MKAILQKTIELIKKPCEDKIKRQRFTSYDNVKLLKFHSLLTYISCRTISLVVCFLVPFPMNSLHQIYGKVLHSCLKIPTYRTLR